MMSSSALLTTLPWRRPTGGTRCGCKQRMGRLPMSPPLFTNSFTMSSPTTRTTLTHTSSKNLPNLCQKAFTYANLSTFSICMFSEVWVQAEVVSSVVVGSDTSRIDKYINILKKKKEKRKKKKEKRKKKKEK